MLAPTKGRPFPKFVRASAVTLRPNSRLRAGITTGSLRTRGSPTNKHKHVAYRKCSRRRYSVRPMPSHVCAFYRQGVIESSMRAAVCVAVDPFLLRSALYQCLLPDPRLTALLCPSGEDARGIRSPEPRGRRVAPTHLDIPHTRVITITPPPGPDGQPDLCNDLAALLNLIELTPSAGGNTALRPQPPATPAPDQRRVDPETQRTT